MQQVQNHATMIIAIHKTPLTFGRLMEYNTDEHHKKQAKIDHTQPIFLMREFQAGIMALTIMNASTCSAMF